MEGSAFRTEPRVSGAILTVVEHLAVDSLVGIVTVFLLCAVKVRLLQQQLQLVGFDLFLLFQQLGLFTVLLRLGLQLWSTRFLDFVGLLKVLASEHKRYFIALPKPHWQFLKPQSLIETFNLRQIFR